MNWAGFYSQERRRRVPLPAYPFERKRFWVESTPAALAPRSVKPQQNETDSLPGSVRKPELTSANGAAHIEAMDAANAPRPQQPAIKSELQVLFGKLLGSDLNTVNGETTFLEMGFDSLMLTQASQSIEKQFGARIPFGQLLGRFSTFELLAAAVEKGAAGAAAIAAQKKGSRTGANQPNDESVTSLLNQ